ncbi:MAG: hypothetical protein K6F84_08230 [Lachnospiraceae bacterium]|nr:hypothetical protein [Lachnospiraceae bacterium]
MNKDLNNLTQELKAPSLPTVVMNCDGIRYNTLYGYTGEQQISHMRDCISVIPSDRHVRFFVDTYSHQLFDLSFQVRSVDGERLIEDTVVEDFVQDKSTVTVDINLKDLLRQDEEYCLIIKLSTDTDTDVRYYTRFVMSDDLAPHEKLQFVKDFHERTLGLKEGEEIAKYLESDESLQDNRSFNYVNIHSSYKMITYDGFQVTRASTPVLQLTDVRGQTAAMTLSFVGIHEDNGERIQFDICEHYRIRYTEERIYLLDYERFMTQIPDESRFCANDKIMLGIVSEEVPMMESSEGNVVAFYEAGALFAYNAPTNKLAHIFSFYDDNNSDIRSRHNEHAVKILNVDDEGDVSYAVFGYMNRGRYEGQVGVQLMKYIASNNTVEEKAFIAYNRSYDVLKLQTDTLLYENAEGLVYLFLDNMLYCVSDKDKTMEPITDMDADDSFMASADNRVVTWTKGEGDLGDQMVIRDLESGSEFSFKAKSGEYVKNLGFIDDDIVYGIVKKSDVYTDNTGKKTMPMYKIVICDTEGKVLKNYETPGEYILSCSVMDNQISLKKAVKNENLSYSYTEDDQIINSETERVFKNNVIGLDIEAYKHFVEIQVTNQINTKTLMRLTPKEVVFEGEKLMSYQPVFEEDVYFVFDPYGLKSMSKNANTAINRAYVLNGSVMDCFGNTIWYKGNRVSRNQIMAIKERPVEEGESSLSVCLNCILELNGISFKTESYLAMGKDVNMILSDNLSNARIMDLSGCSLDSVLYFVNRDIPVLAILDKEDKVVLITGFNDQNVVIMDPLENKLYKKGMNDAVDYFMENGNHFISYYKAE